MRIPGLPPSKGCVLTLLPPHTLPCLCPPSSHQNQPRRWKCRSPSHRSSAILGPLPRRQLLGPGDSLNPSDTRAIASSLVGRLGAIS